MYKIGCGISIMVMLVFAIIMVLLADWTQSNLNWLFSIITNHPVSIPYWLALLLNIFTNFFGFLFNIICEILKYVII